VLDLNSISTVWIKQVLRLIVEVEVDVLQDLLFLAIILWLHVLVEPACLTQSPLTLLLFRLAEAHCLLDVLLVDLFNFISEFLCSAANDEALEVLQTV
jgi:hypothetical protein